MRWIQSSIQLFEDFETSFVALPLLLRYDSSKPTFLKTDWASDGMGYILMQLNDSSASLAAIKHLSLTGES